MDTGDTAWVLISTALILFMTPGLAFFYAGMVRSKNVLGMLMQNYFAMGLISVLWALLGFTIAFGGTGPIIGDLEFAGLSNVTDLDGAIPGMAFVGFQMMFAPESGWSRFAQDCIVRSVLLDAYCASLRIPHN